MPSYSLQDLNSIVRSWGRGVVFYSVDQQGGTTPTLWDPTGPLYLRHLGDTEGDLVINTNPEMASLTTPELTGPAPHEVDYTGEAPQIEVPLYLADPALEAIVSPIGQASAGRSRRSAPREYSLVILPEALFLTTGVSGAVSAATLAVTAGVFTLGGQALTAAQTALLGFGFWAWRVVPTRPPKRFRGGAGDDRKNIETVTFMVCHHPDMPEDHHLYTIGNPYDASINLEGSS